MSENEAPPGESTTASNPSGGPNSESTCKIATCRPACKWCHVSLETTPMICPNCHHFQRTPLFYLQSLGGLILIAISLFALIVSYMQVQTAKADFETVTGLTQDLKNTRSDLDKQETELREFIKEKTDYVDSRVDSLQVSLDHLGGGLLEERLALAENEAVRLMEAIAIIESKIPYVFAAPQFAIFGSVDGPSRAIGEYRCNGTQLEVHSYSDPWNQEAINFFLGRAPAPLAGGGCAKLADLKSRLSVMDQRIAALKTSLADQNASQ